MLRCCDARCLVRNGEANPKLLFREIRNCKIERQNFCGFAAVAATNDDHIGVITASSALTGRLCGEPRVMMCAAGHRRTRGSHLAVPVKKC